MVTSDAVFPACDAATRGAHDAERLQAPPPEKSLLRFITCGSVDDGKSTLIGRLLYDSKVVFDDQLRQLEVDSKRAGTQQGELDFALLVDGLSAEREQGITIDVAYRFFSTSNRKFIVADTPGHQQYTRNMVTGASTADVAVILIDARKGVLTQTRRHAFLVSLLGIGKAVLAVNKMDLVAYSPDVFGQIEADFRAFARLSEIQAIPVSALKGENLTARSASMRWYRGPTLIEYLDNVEPESGRPRSGFRLPVQWVNRPNSEFRGFCGRIVDGAIRPGDRVRALPSGRESAVARIVAAGGDLPVAVAGQSVTVVLADEIDVARGDVLCSPDSPAGVADQFETTIVWMADQPLLPGRRYLIKIGTQVVGAWVSNLKYKIDVNTFEHVASRTLALNEIAVCNISLDRPVAFDPYEHGRDMGGIIIIDRATKSTIGAGLLRFALRRSQNVHWQALTVRKEARAAQKGQKPCVVWLTGLSGSGKSTIANILEKKLHANGRHTYLLDGDNVRLGLNRDLGFTESERIENLRRVAEVAKLMADAGLIVIVSFISPFRAERQMARELFPPGEFIEVFIDTALGVAEKRDPKGLYGKARRGEIENFTGIDSPYEPPENPDVHLDTMTLTAEESADRVLGRLREDGRLTGIEDC